ncbi:haze protective factor 1 isoform X4 [Drosophila mauritiana]|uniref:Haze protective factor 1 isoform X4 n=1 Tax=Drosophila mauritiana TaxID=7226 RepID=A0A6P8KWK6_DROMA|nr:haze protective factor 1 isoform X4 [Drosophila mauritiana]
MRVIAPRRSSTSAAGSGSLYGTSAVGTSSGSTTSSNSTSGSHHISSTGSGAVDRTTGGAATNGYSRISSSYDRGSSLSKWLPTSSGGSNSSGYGSSYYPSSYTTYSANSGSSSASYAPRSSVQRSSVGTTSSTSYISAGSGSSSSAYRTSSYLSGFSYDSPTYSRYGLPRKASSRITTNEDSLSGSAKREDYGLRRGHDTAKKPPISGASVGHNCNNSASRDTKAADGNKRLSSSSSSPSLARLVATSGLDIYEKYSPANYKPNCELSRSRSGHSETDLENGSNKEATPTCTVTLERPRSSTSRYSRLYRNSSDAGGDSSASTGKLGSGKYSISSSSSSGNVPTATFTLRSNRTRRSQEEEAPTSTEVEQAGPAAPSPTPIPPPPPPPTNRHKPAESNGGLEAKLNGLSLLSTSPKRNAIYERNQDTTDDAGVGQDSADNADVSTSATFKLNDSSKLNSCRLRPF